MFVRRLVLANFRCYRRLDLTLPCGTIVVVGRNAQGKTSLIEAIYTLATTRSPHGAADRDLIHWDAGQDGIPFSRAWAEVARGGESLRIEVLNARQAVEYGEERFTKRTLVNDVPRRALDVIGRLNVVLFTPHDIEVVAGAPALRRRYLDVLLCQIDRDYCRALSQYNQVIAQRNHLLRKLRDRGGRPDELAFWDERLAGHGAEVIERRAATVATLEALAREIHADLAGTPADRAPLSIRYLPALRQVSGLDMPSGSSDPGDFAPIQGLLADLAPAQGFPTDRGELGALFRAGLEIGRRDDIARGVTQIGPLRDELAFGVGGIDMRTFGSRGQQRTVALALKLAEAQHMWSATGERPVILLDDVLSELDPERRRHLLERIDPQQQTLISMTDLAGVPEEFLAGALVLYVEAAAITAAERGGRAVTPPVREMEAAV